MVRVEIAQAAADDLRRLILTHSLPPDTPARVRTSLEPLRTFPLLGPALHGRWQGFRFVVGPWRWLIPVYRHLPEENWVVVMTLQDARSSNAVAHLIARTCSAPEASGSCGSS